MLVATPPAGRFSERKSFLESKWKEILRSATLRRGPSDGFRARVTAPTLIEQRGVFRFGVAFINHPEITDTKLLNLAFWPGRSGNGLYDRRSETMRMQPMGPAAKHRCHLARGSRRRTGSTAARRRERQEPGWTASAVSAGGALMKTEFECGSAIATCCGLRRASPRPRRTRPGRAGSVAAGGAHLRGSAHLLPDGAGEDRDAPAEAGRQRSRPQGGMVACRRGPARRSAAPWAAVAPGSSTRSSSRSRPPAPVRASDRGPTCLRNSSRRACQPSFSRARSSQPSRPPGAGSARRARSGPGALSSRGAASRGRGGRYLLTGFVPCSGIRS